MQKQNKQCSSPTLTKKIYTKTNPQPPTVIATAGLIYQLQTGFNHRCFTSFAAPNSIHETGSPEILSLCN